ncbi:caspase family protein [Pseudomethylobacillus aquaticus]|uniref:Caspase family protein n=1 Tax=Pseudomethylobacillus aquaticus TaxID=2676064 RepID=A0A3N0V6Y4_9PROT|nr:caspase family protein [Pseudomethylobacillus aquaticus]ROH88469.1 caspase family protein [Pseudomethylobacillus aquaticus]
MRKALVVGINYYPGAGSLYGCVNDAYAVNQVLLRHMDGALNFDVQLHTSVDSASAISRRQLKDLVIALFADDPEIALLYFAGHGHVEDSGGYLVTSDCDDPDAGLPLDELLTIANESKAKNKVLVLDSCYSGAAGSPKSLGEKALLSEGLTILTASSKDQYATEENGSGVFTKLFVDALNGGAANLTGEITPGGIYAHIDQSLSAWEQRPIFKTNVKRFCSIRRVTPPISLDDLRQIAILFKNPIDEFPLDPSFEPQPPAPNHGIAPDPENNRKFALLQKLNRLNLVKPVGEDHMYFAAMNSKSCRLTVLGEHYWKLVTKGRI